MDTITYKGHTYKGKDAALWRTYGTKTVRYEYGAPALSCCTNGNRIKGVGKVTDLDIGGGLVINDHLRIRESEVIEIL